MPGLALIILAVITVAVAIYCVVKRRKNVRDSEFRAVVKYAHSVIDIDLQ